MADAGSGKADFTDIYTAADPRPYFRALTPLGYQVPRHALPVVETVLAAAPGSPTVLDVCCSYGINAALLRTTAAYDELAARHADPGRAALPSVEVIAADTVFYAARLTDTGRELRILGLDASAPAVGYATATGLLDAGFAEDLETADPSPALAAALRGVGVVVCTGGVGYVGATTFARILRAVDRPDRTRLVVYVLRVFDYTPVADVLAGFGLVTERIPALACRQRRFADAAERAAACRDVAARGLDPVGREADGWYHADCFVSRPAGTTSPFGALAAVRAGSQRRGQAVAGEP
ncbi:hypothetical protein Psed_1917 [Pseudonocardia dioxanivorans CB1190]|uniref:Methyltransferase type 12 n=1 Tax=Pseudonocardia dioxanivorans (strain ATCC 55486 / DSM 44775 / JCM 13855 / CB1190) TaxID=675635 RepID=F4CU72_PSEUX|nr:hypothetical protein [Pseudonocardia dioxanivorans]AEA24150.1 hypothetical protein Psed_1917 [Pseudonocardia dioxanivorans CB1190]GJF07413.1 methyltransferase type 12 [Pseudonocardia sp. D17]